VPIGVPIAVPIEMPIVAAGAGAATFEIDEVEPLPDEDAGLLDLHEGASDFIPVEHPRQSDEAGPDAPTP
jgi:hypothetical protein